MDSFIIGKTKSTQIKNEKYIFRASFSRKKSEQLKKLLAFVFLDVQFELDILVACKEPFGSLQIVLVDVNISKVECDALERKFYLPRHQIQVVDVSRQTERSIRTALIS